MHPRYDAAMGGSDERPGLRERKKRETRARLINAAVGLVEKQGYAQTTVEQIADAVDVSPRTVAHYFASKDQLLLSVVDTYADAVVDQLTAIPAGVGPLEALHSANVAVLEKARDHSRPGPAESIASLLRTLHVSPALQPLAHGLRSPRLCAELAHRMNTTPEDRRVELVVALWGAIATTSWSGVNKRWNEQAEPTSDALLTLLRDRLDAGFDELCAIVGELPD